MTNDELRGPPDVSERTMGCRPSFWLVVRRWSFVIFCLLAPAGCDRAEGLLAPRQRERDLRTAESRRQSGDYRGAAAAYEASLDGTAGSADAHFLLALLLRDRLDDPLGAAYHLHRYLDLAPEGRHAREAKATLGNVETNLATRLGNGTLLTRSEALKIKEDNVVLRKQVGDLQTELASRPPATTGPNAGLPANPVVSAAIRAAQERAKKSGKTYQVQPGDTPAKIALKVYKNKARYKDILDANYNQLGDPPKPLKPGMTLLIP